LKERRTSGKNSQGLQDEIPITKNQIPGFGSFHHPSTLPSCQEHFTKK
jgi:hypothetical protein